MNGKTRDISDLVLKEAKDVFDKLYKIRDNTKKCFKRHIDSEWIDMYKTETHCIVNLINRI